MIYRFKTADCPDADGRVPEAGDQMWTLSFPLEEGGRLHVQVGKVGRDALLAMLAMEEAGDAAERTGA